MSDWYRSRDDDQRRYRDDERRQWGARDRRSDDYGQGAREQRSFDEPGRDYRGRDYRSGDWREGQRDRYQGSQGYGEPRSPRYGQPYGTQEYGSQSDRSSGLGYGGRGYGAQPDYGARSYYGDERRRSEQGQSDFIGRNEVLRRQEDGETDQQLWSTLGRGEHRGRGPRNYTRSDDRIREDVNDRLSDDDWLDATEIEVQVKACEVTLAGTVNNREDRRRAEDIAEQVSGVKHVQNNLRLNQQPSGAAGSQAPGSGTQLS